MAGFRPYVHLLLVLIIIISAYAKFHETGERSKRSADEQLRSKGFGSKSKSREKRSIQNGGRLGGQWRNFDQLPEGTQILVAPCQHEGLVLIQRKANYYMKCVRNDQTGGFYQVVYICPKELHEVADTSNCVPPPSSLDCEQCNQIMSVGEKSVPNSQTQGRPPFRQVHQIDFPGSKSLGGRLSQGTKLNGVQLTPLLSITNTDTSAKSKMKDLTIANKDTSSKITGSAMNGQQGASSMAGRSMIGSQHQAGFAGKQGMSSMSGTSGMTSGMHGAQSAALSTDSLYVSSTLADVGNQELFGSSFQEYFGKISLDESSAQLNQVYFEFELDAFLNDVGFGVGLFDILFRGIQVGQDSTSLCHRRGIRGGSQPSLYTVCAADVTGGFRSTTWDCGRGYIFVSFIGRCVHMSAKDLLHRDAGILYGPGKGSQRYLPGYPSCFEASSFRGHPSQPCSHNSMVPFGRDDRFYVLCWQPHVPGILYQCPFGYFFSTIELKCVSGVELGSATSVYSEGVRVARASPMFLLPECTAPGTFGYPDYRFYYTCHFTPGSLSPTYERRVHRCMVGLFYNPTNGNCTPPSSFFAHNYNYSWNGVKTQIAFKSNMNLRAGLSVHVESIPFHVPVSPKAGKFAAVDIRFYYTTMKGAVGRLRTQLYICHSGFYFSQRAGQCVPAFEHEYILAGISYGSGVDVASLAGVNLKHKELLADVSTKHAWLATPNLGLPTNAILSNPGLVFGIVVAQNSLPFNVEPCLAVGYFAIPDYRFYYTCLTKRPFGLEVGDNNLGSTGKENQEASIELADGEEEYIQTFYQCPTGLYYSNFYGFCIASLLHHVTGAEKYDMYSWRKNSLKDASHDASGGLEWDLNNIPWVTAPCSHDGKFGVRDPRYYYACRGAKTQLYICPSNTYFSAQSGQCETLAHCNCWSQVGYARDPNPKLRPTGFGTGMDIDIYLDRSYEQVLRKLVFALTMRATRQGQSRAHELSLVPRLIWFWKDMEKQRTLHYPRTANVPNPVGSQQSRMG